MLTEATRQQALAAEARAKSVRDESRSETSKIEMAKFHDEQAEHAKSSANMKKRWEAQRRNQ
jgi:hypothetical protein